MAAIRGPNQKQLNKEREDRNFYKNHLAMRVLGRVSQYGSFLSGVLGSLQLCIYHDVPGAGWTLGTGLITYMLGSELLEAGREGIREKILQENLEKLVQEKPAQPDQRRVSEN